MNQSLEIITKMENENKLFEENLEKIRRLALNQFVAIENGEIIEQDKELENLMKKVENKGKNPALILIRYVYEKGFKFIL
jgi:hypothetical protein